MSAPAIISSGTSAGGPPVGGSGTPNTIPMWTAGSTLGNSAVTQVSGSIFSLTGLVGGAGYVANASGVPLTGGTGTGATASIVVSGGSVQWANLEAPGSGYTVGDVLGITGGTGTITVLAVVPKNDASGHFTAKRIGAGTSQPRAGIDSQYGGYFTGWQRQASPGGTTSTNAIPNIVSIAGDVDPSVSGLSSIAGVNAMPVYVGANPSSVIGVYSWPSVSNTSGVATVPLYAGFFRALRGWVNDTNTATQLNGMFVSIGHTTGGAASYTTNLIRGIRVNSFYAVPGTITDFYGFSNATSNITNATAITTYRAFSEDGFALSGGASIGTYYGLYLGSVTGSVTTRWGIYQEDALAKNYFAGTVGIGTTSPASAMHVRNNTAGITLDSTLGGGRQYQLNPLRTGLSNSGFEIRDVTAGAAVISIDASQQVGIGTASPDSRLHVSLAGLASLRIGYAGTSVNYYDAGTHNFRDGGGNPAFTITAGATKIADLSVSGWGLKLPNAPNNGDPNTLDSYREGTRTLSAGDLSGWTYVTATQYWTLVGRTVTLHTVFTGGTSSATGGATIATPPLLTPLRIAAGAAVNSSGTALGNGVCVCGPSTATTGVVQTSSAISSSAVDKVLTVTYETAGL